MNNNGNIDKVCLNTCKRSGEGKLGRGALPNLLKKGLPISFIEIVSFAYSAFENVSVHSTYMDKNIPLQSTYLEARRGRGLPDFRLL